jgi:hypothetical protein
MYRYWLIAISLFILISCEPPKESSELLKQYEFVKQKEKEQQEWIRFEEKKSIEELQKINPNFYKTSPTIKIIASASLLETELNNTIKAINPEYGYVTYRTYSGNLPNESRYDLIIFKINSPLTIEKLEKEAPNDSLKR